MDTYLFLFFVLKCFSITIFVCYNFYSLIIESSTRCVMGERKIMSYPFTGFDYKDIMEVGNRVRITNDNEKYGAFFIASYKDPRYGMRQEKRVDVIDDNLKSTLYYFKFLTDMCRVRPYFARTYSYNIYIDTILICINEIVSECKICGVNPDYNEILARFGKQYNPDDLHKLYSKASDYEYLNELFKFLNDDSFLINVSRFKENGIYLDRISDGYIGDIAADIINNKDDIEFLGSSKENVYGPQLTKKISKPQVI